MAKLELGYAHVSEKVYAGQPKKLQEPDSIHKVVDVTESFKKCVVLFCGKENVFEVDGMIFRVTCERVK